MKRIIYIITLLCALCTSLFAEATKTITSTKQVGDEVVLSPKSGYSMYVKITEANLEGLRVVKGDYNMATYSTVRIQAIKRGSWQFGVTHGDGTATVYVWNVVDVIDIDIPQNVTLKVGDSFTYNPVITDSNANTTLTWYSSNTSVATISDNGVLSARSVGTSSITVTASNGVKATSTVVVEPVKVQSIQLENGPVEMQVGETRQLNYTVSPTNATNKAVIFTSSNPGVVDVSPSGELIALSSGYSFVSVRSQDGSNVVSSIKVSVLEQTTTNCNVVIDVSKYGFAQITIPCGEDITLDYSPYSELWKIASVECNGTELEPQNGGTQYIVSNICDDTNININIEPTIKISAELSGVNNVTVVNDITYSLENGVLKISGVKDRTLLEIYLLNGIKINSLVIESNNEALIKLPPNIYIIILNNHDVLKIQI